MSVARHTAYNLVGAVVPVLVSLVTIPIYLKVIGLDRYGVLAICWVLVGYFGLFEFGLGPAVAQRIATLSAQPAGVRSAVAWGALGLSLALGTLGCLLLWAVAGPLLGAMKGLTPSLSSEARDAVEWLGLLVPLSTTYAVLSGALQGRQQFLVMNIMTSSGNILVGVAPLAAALLQGPALPHLIAALVTARLCIVAALLLACWRRVPLERPAWPSSAILGSLVAFGGWVAAAAALTPVLTSAEKVAIGWMIGAAAVSVYMIPFTLLGRMTVLPQSLASALIPRFATLSPDEVDDFEHRLLASFSRLITPIMLLAMIVLAPFLQLWVGDKLGTQGTPLGMLLIAGIWFNCCTYVPYSRLQGTGRPQLVTKLVALQALPYLLFLILCMKVGHLAGAAFAWSFRMAIEMVLLIVGTGQPRRLLSSIWWQAGVVVIGAAVGFVAPFPDPRGTLLLLALLTGTLVAAFRRIRHIGVYLPILRFVNL
jgi:O-antigen/teichoic acid export membrane protein